MMVPYGFLLKYINAYDYEYVPLLDGRTLPIKFWINRCAVADCGADSCNHAGYCNYAIGACVREPFPDGTACNGDVCTNAGGCAAGVCVGATPIYLTSGDGTADNPYSITTAEQLQHAACNKGGHVRLDADIDLAGQSFNPIESPTPDPDDWYLHRKPFMGVFDGNGHVVRNCSILRNYDTDYWVGLFQANAGTIKNLTPRELQHHRLLRRRRAGGRKLGDDPQLSRAELVGDRPVPGRRAGGTPQQLRPREA